MASEKRLIDANALTEKIDCPGEPLVYWYDIEAAPTVDAVEVVRCKNCEHSRRWGNEGTLLCYRDETTVHIVKPDAYCDGSQRRYDADDPEVLKFEPVVHAYWERYNENGDWRCSHCKGYHFHNGGMIKKYKRCPNCGAHMDLKEADHGK